MVRRQTLTQYLEARVEQVIQQNMTRWATLMPNAQTYFTQPAYQPQDRPTLSPASLNTYIVDVLPIDAYPIR
jgi:hypothetical protein